MPLLRGVLLARILLGLMGLMLLLLAWGSILSMAAYGPAPESTLVMMFSVPLALICLSVAMGVAPFRIRE